MFSESMYLFHQLGWVCHSPIRKIFSTYHLVLVQGTRPKVASKSSHPVHLRPHFLRLLWCRQVFFSSCHLDQCCQWCLRFLFRFELRTKNFQKWRVFLAILIIFKKEGLATLTWMLELIKRENIVTICKAKEAAAAATATTASAAFTNKARGWGHRAQK